MLIPFPRPPWGGGGGFWQNRRKWTSNVSSSNIRCKLSLCSQMAKKRGQKVVKRVSRTLWFFMQMRFSVPRDFHSRRETKRPKPRRSLRHPSTLAPSLYRHLRPIETLPLTNYLSVKRHWINLPEQKLPHLVSGKSSKTDCGLRRVSLYPTFNDT